MYARKKNQTVNEKKILKYWLFRFLLQALEASILAWKTQSKWLNFYAEAFNTLKLIPHFTNSPLPKAHPHGSIKARKILFPDESSPG
jgi:hypothetical protein